MNHDSLNLKGLIPALVTPFNSDESLDLESLERLIRFTARVGVDGITVLGLLGESNRLTDSERMVVISRAVNAASPLPVIVGTSHASTRGTIELSRAAIGLGAAAVMIAPSTESASHEDSLLDYFKHVAAHVSAPIVLQDYPPGSQVHMSISLILRLVQEVPTIAGIKAESVPTPAKIAALKAGMANGRKAPVLTGLGALYGFFDLERGSDGFNTGFAFPEVLSAILREFRLGDIKAARRIFNHHLPLLVFEQQPGVAIRKELLRRRGLLTHNRVRHPGATIDTGTAEQLTRLMASVFADVDITQPLCVCV